jgi:hypothetical protein
MKRGRPPLDPDDPSVKVCLSLPGKRYDALWRAATDARTTVGAVIRDSLAKTFRNPKSARRPVDG